jgi:GT2 family glycosyltransferase/glycosyltransferase involved in cell wall biosynthesis
VTAETGKDRDDLLASLHRSEHALDRYRRSYRALAEEVRRLHGEAAAWRSRAETLETSPAIQLVRRLRADADRVAPPGTARRRAAGALARRARSAVVSHSGARARGEHPEVPPPAQLSPVPVVPMALQPEVTIVVPVHDQWDRTAACLRSIAADRCSVGFEVVVVDDASADETVEALPSVTGVVGVRLEENLGFVGAVNAGIERARGRFVVLLNNDTEVEPGWLDALVATAESDPQIGVVGAKLVYPDGRLQEAGGVIWEDGSGHNYGRDQDADDPRFGFVRDVDYCSGACLLVRRELLALVGGGLDPRFSPAYYDDTDLCFAARQHGYRVVYQPAAAVRHFEGASHGTDVTSGIKRYQEVHRHTFVEKWAEVLPRHGAPDHEHVRMSSWRAPAGHCLVMDHALPMPDFDSGSRRMAELLGILGDLGFAVTFVPQNGIDLPDYRRPLAARGIEVLRSPADLDDYVHGVLPDLRLAVLSRPTVAWANYPMLRSLAPDALMVYDTVDLHYVRERRRALAEDDSWSATRSADYHYGMEKSLVGLVDQVWVVTDTEAAVLREADPSTDVAVVPNVHRAEPAGPPFEAREGLLFVGNYAHDPNRDAVDWLVGEILPRVRRMLGEVPVTLVGSRVTEEVQALADDGVTVAGWLPTLDGMYRRSRLFVAPLRYGAGMKGKVGEACAYGLPVVTTSVGAEGMGLVDGEDVLVADDEDEFADAVVRAYHDAELWGRLAAGGRRAVEARLSPARVRSDLAQTLKARGLAVVEPR